MERVADYPRPPRLEPAGRWVRVVLGGVTILDTDAAWRVLETYHPPSYYLPQAAFLPGSLAPTPDACPAALLAARDGHAGRMPADIAIKAAKPADLLRSFLR